jgi:cytoskeletal protein RodZ
MTMPSAKDSLSYGQYLQASRLEQQISLERVSEETRIGLGILKLIENEDHEKLPAEVFVKGFLRAYARAIGVDGMEAVRRYESRLSVAHTLNGSGTESGAPQPGRWWKLLLATVLYFALIFLTIFGLSFFEEYSTYQTTPESQTIEEASSSTNTQSPKELEAEEESKDRESDKHLLRLTAQEDTWIKIIIDDGESKEYKLTSGDNLELEALSNFNLLIGNAAGIRVTLNDKIIPILGKSGEIVNLDLP